MGRGIGSDAEDYPGAKPWRFTGGTIRRVAIDVSGQAYIDLEREAAAMLIARIAGRRAPGKAEGVSRPQADVPSRTRPAKPPRVPSSGSRPVGWTAWLECWTAGTTAAPRRAIVGFVERTVSGGGAGRGARGGVRRRRHAVVRDSRLPAQARLRPPAVVRTMAEADTEPCVIASPGRRRTSATTAGWARAHRRALRGRRTRANTARRVLLGGVGTALAGIGVEDFEAQRGGVPARDAQHPTLGRGYLETRVRRRWSSCSVYLEANGFTEPHRRRAAAVTSCAQISEDVVRRSPSSA